MDKQPLVCFLIYDRYIKVLKDIIITIFSSSTHVKVMVCLDFFLNNIHISNALTISRVSFMLFLVDLYLRQSVA